MKQKSILEQALLQVETLEEAVKQNAKGILANTMKQELNELLKEESSQEEDEVETENTEQFNPDEEDETKPEEEETTDSEEVVDTPDEEEDTNIDPESDSNNFEDLSLPTGDDIETPGEESDFETEDDDESDEDMLDLTGASDSEVLKVFKAMKSEDGIVVKKDGNKIELEDGDNDYIIKLNEGEYGFGDDPEYNPNSSEDNFDDDDEVDPSFEEILRGAKKVPSRMRPSFDKEDDRESDSIDNDELSLGEEDETIYEIELDEDDDDELGTDEFAPEGEFSEAARTKWNPHGNKGGMNRAGLKSKKVFKAGSGQGTSVNEEVEALKKKLIVLKEQNTEYKKALALFKEKLNEIAVFNANLAYSTRLFTENTTTKQEKLDILKRFDSVSTLNESKTLYSTIKGELGTKKPVSETIVKKISTTPTPSAAKDVLSESKAYVNPEFERIKDLMRKVK